MRVRDIAVAIYGRAPLSDFSAMLDALEKMFTPQPDVKDFL